MSDEVNDRSVAFLATAISAVALSIRNASEADRVTTLEWAQYELERLSGEALDLSESVSETPAEDDE